MSKDKRMTTDETQNVEAIRESLENALNQLLTDISTLQIRRRVGFPLTGVKPRKGGVFGAC